MFNVDGALRWKADCIYSSSGGWRWKSKVPHCGGNGPSGCMLPTLSAIEESPVEGSLGEVGGCDCSGISTALGIQASRGVWIILLAPLCNTQTQPPFPSLPHQPPPVWQFITNWDHWSSLWCPREYSSTMTTKTLFTSGCQSLWSADAIAPTHRHNVPVGSSLSG